MESNKKTNRKLCSIQIIKEIKPHPYSDSHQIAVVLGWEIVITKDEFKEKEKVIYFEIDSLLPKMKWSLPFAKQKYQVKSIKIKGNLSQGLILSLSILNEHSLSTNEADYEEGYDLTGQLNIEKYEDDSEILSKNKKNNKENQKNMNKKDEVQKTIPFPNQFGFLKTEEERIQSTPDLIEEMKGKSFYATLKYDGTSATYFYDKEEDFFYILSRNQVSNTPPYSKCAEKFKIEEVLKSHNGRYAIQGEIYGLKIQENPFLLKEIDFVVFSIYDTEIKRYLDFEEMKELCIKLKLKMVDIVIEGDSFNYKIEDLKELVKGNYANTDNPREGLVFRTKKNWIVKVENNEEEEVYKKYSFKIINDMYLLNKNKK